MSECKTKWVCPKCGLQTLKLEPHNKRAFTGIISCNCGFYIEVDMVLVRPELRSQRYVSKVSRSSSHIVPLM